MHSDRNTYRNIAILGGGESGVGAALLLGTEEGRQFTSKLLDTVKDNLDPSLRVSGNPEPKQSPRSDITPSLLSNPESTPHSTTYINRSEALAKDGNPPTFEI